MLNNEIEKKLLLLQVNDALFPIGSYAHSFGLETYIQKGFVNNAETAFEYIEKRMLYGLAYTELLAVRFAYETAMGTDLDNKGEDVFGKNAESIVKELSQLEERLEASRIPMELREAAYKLGSRFTKTLEHMEVKYVNGIFRKYVEERRGKTVSHSCAYGVFCADVGITKEDAFIFYLYAQLSYMFTNCVKAVPLGKSVGQKLFFSLYPYC